MSDMHPVLTMKHGRSKIWKEQATDDDFMVYLAELARIYAIRKQKEEAEKTGKIDLPDETILFKDYKIWLDK